MPGPPSVSIIALIKASRPSFQSPSDKVAFAIHAICALNGFKLLATGDDVVKDPLPGPDSPEVSVDGWDRNEGLYSFLYGLENAAPGGTLLLKCLTVGDSLMVTMLVTLGAKDSNTEAPLLPPETLQLDLQRHATPEGPDSSENPLAPAFYGHLQELSDVIQDAIESQLDAAQPSSKAATTVNKAQTTSNKDAGASSYSPYEGSRSRDPPPWGYEGGDDPLRVGLPRGPPLRSPLMVGDGDLMPRGSFDPLRMPSGRGYGSGFGPTGGGMHVGPGHPFFSDRLRNPDLASGGRGGVVGGGMGPGGVRWDPIAPEGLQGWHPEDFQRGPARPGRVGHPGPPVHPDVMQPGPGRGADWDHMFG